MITTDHRAQIGRPKKDRRRALFSGDWLASSVGPERAHAEATNSRITMSTKTETPQGVGTEAMVRLSLPADVCRCFGGGCADKEHCQRYIARNERWPELSYIQGGAFVNGVCLYRIEPNVASEPR